MKKLVLSVISTFFFLSLGTSAHSMRTQAPLASAPMPIILPAIAPQLTHVLAILRALVQGNIQVPGFGFIWDRNTQTWQWGAAFTGLNQIEILYGVEHAPIQAEDLDQFLNPPQLSQND